MSHKNSEKQECFMTVDWCNEGRRGILCDAQGHAAHRADRPFTIEEMMDALGPFGTILNPRNILLTESQLKAYNHWTSLEEFLDEWGIARPSNGYYPGEPHDEELTPQLGEV